MADITLHTSSDTGVTCVSNAFIDEYMKDANGEFVKIYLYLLRLLGQDKSDIDISMLAEKLDHTVRDVRRALAYWEKNGLVVLEYDDNDELTGVFFREPTTLANVSANVSTEHEASNISAVHEVVNDTASDKKDLPKRGEYSLSQVQSFKENDDIEEMLFVIEKYLGRNLTPTDLNYIIYWIKELSFSTELVYYLVEYCIDKGHPNIKYMDRIAIDWANNDIDSVDEAKEDTILHSKIYVAVCKSFGINNRALVKSELDYVKKWKKLSLGTDIIEEALRRTLVNTNKANFEYADKIIDNWAAHNVKKLDDIKAVDEEYKQNNKKGTRSKKSTASNKFNNFESRDYNFKDLEQLLTNKG